MTPDDLKARTKKFAVDVIQFARSIPRDPINGEIASQLTDAATSVAAHYRAVCRAKSRADFIHKLSGAIEEVDESALWLEILTESGISASSKTTPSLEGSRRADADSGQVTRNGEVQSTTTINQSQMNQQSRIVNRQLIANQRSKDQKSNEALIFANRPCTTVVGVSHVPTGLYAWL